MTEKDVFKARWVALDRMIKVGIIVLLLVMAASFIFGPRLTELLKEVFLK